MVSKRKGLQMHSLKYIQQASSLCRTFSSGFLEQDVSFIRRLKREVRSYICRKKIEGWKVILYPGLLKASCKTENGKKEALPVSKISFHLSVGI